MVLDTWWVPKNVSSRSLTSYWTLVWRSNLRTARLVGRLNEEQKFIADRPEGLVGDVRWWIRSVGHDNEQTIFMCLQWVVAECLGIILGDFP
jgi:hypothetical protein